MCVDDCDGLCEHLLAKCSSISKKNSFAMHTGGRVCAARQESVYRVDATPFFSFSSSKFPKRLPSNGTPALKNDAREKVNFPFE